MLKVSENQFKALEAVCDTFVRARTSSTDPEYWSLKASDLKVAEEILVIIGGLTATERKEFQQLLSLLENPLVGLVWGRSWGRFRQLNPAVQERVLRCWSGSRFNLFRKAFQSVKRLTTFLSYGSSEDGMNPSWKAMGYPGPLDLPPGPIPKIRPLTPQVDMEFSCDVVVVGSGAGGGVVAGMLAEAGQHVIVIEKGPFVSGKGWNQRETEMVRKTYDGQGALVTKDAGVTVLAGSCLGGGTAVNWTGSFPTPDYVLDEWDRDHGFSAASSQDYADGLATVMSAIHANPENSPHNPQNAALVRGSEQLGQDVGVIHRNVDGCRDADDCRACGYCGLGCRRGTKRSTTRTWLQRASAAGAQFLVNTEVSRVAIQRGVATGVIATTHNAAGQPIQLWVRAPRVVVAAGSVQTPALLLRSGLQHPHLGRNLFFHPTVAVSAFYGQPIEPWLGVMMSGVNKTGTRREGNFGYWIETPPLHTGMAGYALPWISPEQHKNDLLRVRNMASFIVLTRDRHGGQVTVDKQGRARIDYRLHDFDRGNMLAGIRSAWAIHVAAGAQEVIFPHNRRKILSTDRPQAETSAFLNEMPNWGWKPNQFSLFTAHQMGTCAMGGDAARHPVDPSGAWRGLKGLYVADGSLMPTCAGINPMISIMGLAHWVARGLLVSAPERQAAIRS
ncbi:MAG: GMC family oxidoreductase N-terminal domain-containing protein [Bacteroidota bacterium]